MSERKADSQSNLTWRRMLLLIPFFGFTILIVTRFANITDLVRTLGQGNWFWIAAAVLTHVLYFYINAVMFKYSFATVDVKSSANELFGMLLASLFINAVFPIGGAAGAAVFIDYAEQKDQSGGRAAVGVLLELVADLSTLLPFLIFAMIYLAGQGKFQILFIVGVAFFLIYILGLTAILVVSGQNEEKTHDVMEWIQKALNKLGGLVHHPNLISDQWVDRTTHEFVQGASTIRDRPKDFTRMLIWAMVMHVVNLVGLYFFFLGYNQPVRLGTLVAAFGLGIVFFVVTVVPQGVGAVEGVMGLVFISEGIPGPVAAAITFAYRGVNFWIPVLAGLFYFRRTSFAKGEEIGGADKKAENEAPADVQEKVTHR